MEDTPKTDTISKSMEVDDLIAELCLIAPSESVKNCLRIYDYFKTTAKIESDMYQNCTKAILVETANLLKIRNAALKNKEPLTHLIVCRIQNLLPDNCGICKERYSVKLLDTPLLECAICGQEVHRKCFMSLVKAAMPSEDNELQDLDATKFQALFNPLQLPGIFYICKACQVTTIPDEETGNSKTKKKGSKKVPNKIVQTGEQPSLPPDNREDDLQVVEEPESQVEESTEDGKHKEDSTTRVRLSLSEEDKDDSGENKEEETQPNVKKPETLRNAATQQQQTDEEDAFQIANHHQGREDIVSLLRDTPMEQEKKAKCRFFLKGTCKFGLSGKECKFEHPKVCKKFTQHGTRQPRGCKLGQSCKDYHPKMCLNSLRKGECFSESCKYNHVKGTKRHPPQIKMNTTQSAVTSSDAHVTAPTAAMAEPESNGNFLELIRLMKAEILQTFEEKMKQLTNAISVIQAQQAKMAQPMPIQYGMQPQQPMMRMPPAFIPPNQCLPQPAMVQSQQ